jgi:hypothetical protein
MLDIVQVIDQRASRRGAYTEWRNGHYGFPPPKGLSFLETQDYHQRLSEHRASNPLIAGWRSPVAELDAILLGLRDDLRNGVLGASCRRRVGGERWDMRASEWFDLALWETVNGLLFLDTAADLLAVMSSTVEPPVRDVIFYAEPIARVTPQPPLIGLQPEPEPELEPEPAPTEEPPELEAKPEPQDLSEAAEDPSPPAEGRPDPPSTLEAAVREFLSGKWPEGDYPEEKVLLGKLREAGIKASRSTLTRAKRGPR